MIIHSIRAKNVLKYAELSIDLADAGLIGISGANESGKSSIGETVCFALFGRTFSIGPDEHEKIVRWGEDDCWVSVDFSVEGQRYLLSRFLDRDGRHSVKLGHVEEEDGPLVRGVKPVADRLLSILGFAYDEFVESFYLAQREITTPHPHSHAVKLMAGVAPLETVSKALRTEITEREETIGEINAEWEAVDGDIKALGIQDGYLPRLEDQHQATGRQREDVKSVIESISGGLLTYTENSTEIGRLGRSVGRATVLRATALLLALAVGGLWALLTVGADLPEAETARGLLAGYVSGWDDGKTPLMGYLGAGLGVLFLLSWLRIGRLRRRMQSLREESQQLTEVLARARAIDVDAVDAVETQGDEPTDDTFLPARPEHGEYEMLRKLLERSEATPRLAAEHCEREVGWLNRVVGRLTEQMGDLDEEIEDEQTRLQEAMNLSDVLNGLTDKREEIEERIAERQLGLELLDLAIVHLSSRFNREIKDLVGRMLPLFTDRRYEHLQIDDGLRIRVFSNEKRDFMDLEEVSSGTQRQIMLALRLALSKKLLSRTVKGKQFVFLDEPFAFFDQERTRTALQALADLGDDISQVWIVAQGFPEDSGVTFDTMIHCDRDSDSLIVSA